MNFVPLLISLLHKHRIFYKTNITKYYENKISNLNIVYRTNKEYYSI